VVQRLRGRATAARSNDLAANMSFGNKNPHEEVKLYGSMFFLGIDLVDPNRVFRV